MYDIGMIGLAVMGENLVLNIESKGFSVCSYDISTERMTAFENSRAKGKKIGFASSLEDLIAKLSKPRKVMMMIRSGDPVDEVISKLIPLLDKGDIIIDGGNSNFEDTQRRYNEVTTAGLLYVGSGVSGGEEGALLGPSMMPGGSIEAWKHLSPIFEKVAAKTDNGLICTGWIGPDGAGHFVKMVHNGIEYGDIQLITEAYHIMRDGLGMCADEMADVFSSWNEGELDSYLIEITASILRKKDDDDSPLVDKILDTAGQKGTGKWTAINSLHHGVPLSLIGEAVYARFLSAQKEERVIAANVYNRKIKKINKDRLHFLTLLKNALYVAKILSYAQGFSLLRQASDTFNWDLNYGQIATLWRGGCIIRSRFLDKINNAFENNSNLTNLMIDSFFKEEIQSRIDDYRYIVSEGVLSGIPMSTLSAGLAYFDGYTTERLPANLLQAMRDYFGAHTYERIDQKRGKFFHTNWTGTGGTTSSTTYDV
ncbi:MAG: decarboxylating NADP(+)-dependent phosphogluconate dehydrogenase [Candidatus Izemoplasmataceae bacterium]